MKMPDRIENLYRSVEEIQADMESMNAGGINYKHDIEVLKKTCSTLLKMKQSLIARGQ